MRIPLLRLLIGCLVLGGSTPAAMAAADEGATYGLTWREDGSRAQSGQLTGPDNPMARRALVLRKEAQIKGQVQDLLDRLYGPGQATTKVELEMGFTHTSSAGKAKPIVIWRTKHMDIHVDLCAAGMSEQSLKDLKEILLATAGADTVHRHDTLQVRLQPPHEEPDTIKVLLEDSHPSHDK